ncbi:arginase [Rhodospirillaceae bacterium KN72]|uniref:Arginase n=1 Tax=Pacificispira spongiicola TaxID=2729598 RepID=A0A7Y0DZ83_9PROT|nr:arginase [Pacificispira spongiicola]NMM44309.1 arginase [Pacificispira spongiicola]
MDNLAKESVVRKPSLALIGAPTDIGAGHRGGSMGPEALRVAGLKQALERLGYSVEDRGNLNGPVNPDQPPVDGYRHLPEVVEWCTSVRDGVRGILEDDKFPILLGGDHCLAIGSLAGLAQYCAARGEAYSVLWLDAHADYNTAEVSPSGNIHGMPLAVATGHGPKGLVDLGPATPFLDPERVVQIGIRSVDAVEKRLVVSSGMEVHDMRRIDENGMRHTMEEALYLLKGLGGHVHVSFDVDFLDPSIAPGVGTTVPGGPTYREAQLCMEMIHDSGLMRSLDLMELNPAYDIRNATADLTVDLVESLFGQQILSRHDAAL